MAQPLALICRSEPTDVGFSRPGMFDLFYRICHPATHMTPPVHGAEDRTETDCNDRHGNEAIKQRRGKCGNYELVVRKM